MKTLTAQLAAFDEQKAARFRGIVLRQLIRAGCEAPATTSLLHLFLLPPAEGSSRFAIYETSQPADFSLELPELTRTAVEALKAADLDPRRTEGADQSWREVDADEDALYLGTGARFASSNPELNCTTIARLVDETALYLTQTTDGQPLLAQVSNPCLINDEKLPAAEIAELDAPPFQLIDTLEQCLR
ncbi:hypothetical protein FPZ12_027555 [Amycolatopsis acidicola]|uniref:Uncharacterized protein n=1 Tax=Amycolatopsis acidicola TaxID=2596893 RepID=A0A5N0UYF1_9PSEU|nr:hypothetical protein [Amycolatopsis acidicola]KAA9156446.1 hypothetical protein FPZ12_027555 [Amycolatopsis acidicola]